MRRHFVRDLYSDALFELLRKKTYQEISVSDLVRKSGASRASFYRNYSSKEDIVEEYLANIFNNTFERHPLNANNMREEVCSILSEIYSHRDKLLLLQKAGLLNMIDLYMLKETLHAIKKLNVLNNRYQPHFFAGAVSAMIKAWVAYGFEEKPEELCDIFFRSLSGYMVFD